MLSTGEITDVFEKMDGLEKEIASFKAKIESIQRTTQVESAELDINRLDELKQNRYRYSPDCIVISEIKKLDEIKKETTFTMKDRFNANIMTGCLRAYVGYAESFFHTLGKGKPEDQWIIPMVKQTLLKLEGLSKHIHY
ncbi:hypothetical protein LQV05_005785 [Cryptococcus neoformans]|nr:hypothetical protein C356_04577 [Cryptococcus neoformans var. grubii c45]OXB35775.1 hypothetical protein J007_04507 [Cryptococcus neoformans var. grubii]OXC59920.1 hypothetical protein C358_04621 [Cryptococcus neoformans var. grubii MW-RSA852]UOH83071.1 hypothetical protein LQV05_005785 [Cryptococcus neoformans]